MKRRYINIFDWLIDDGSFVFIIFVRMCLYLIICVVFKLHSLIAAYFSHLNNGDDDDDDDDDDETETC